MIAIFSPNGRTIATASASGARDIQLIDAESGEMWCRMVGHTSAVYTVSWCPYDGSNLSSGGADGTCKELGTAGYSRWLSRRADKGWPREAPTARRSCGTLGQGRQNIACREIPDEARTTQSFLTGVGARLGAGHAGGNGVRDGAPLATRGGVSGA